MVKKKNNSEPKFYVYYDKRTGEIFSVSNERTDKYEYELATTHSEVEKFLSGEWHFSNYLVGYKRLSDDSTVLSIMPKVDDEFAFRNNIYEWIQPSDKDTEVILEWNKLSRCWYISLSKKAIKSYTDGILTPKLVFFVTLETDLDFLIRIITVDMQELMLQKKISVPFTSSFENNINQVSVGTRLIFKTYGLKVTHE